MIEKGHYDVAFFIAYCFANLTNSPPMTTVAVRAGAMPARI